jgi:RNase adapter protein RapZ
MPQTKKALAGPQTRKAPADHLEFTMITGLSGAGRSEAIRCFEDIGYFCIDNLPPMLLSQLAELALLPGSRIRKVAVVSDVRGGMFFDTLLEELGKLRAQGVDYQILFLEAADETLVNRFKETRRRHPLAKEGSIIEGIQRERELLEPFRGQADLVLDTTELTAGELRDRIRTQFLGTQKRESMLISVTSFGYKFGMPMDADIVMDVRFLPNPHYVAELREHTGREEVVRRFVLGRRETKAFLKRWLDLLKLTIPDYIVEGKTHLAIAIGCTGGQHRSVALADETAGFLTKLGYSVVVHHRELAREPEKS